MDMKEIIELMKEFAKNNDYGWRGSYSGRWMYGSKCVAFTLGQGQNPLDLVMELCDWMHEAGYESVSELLGSPSMDSLGMGSIVYFPDIEAEEEDEDEEEEDEDEDEDEEEEV